MRYGLTLVLGLAFGLTACAAFSAHWEKPGADQAMLDRDLSACRIAAREESMRNYYPAPAPLFGARRWWAWDQYSESSRFYTEGNLTRFCMRNKGYELVPDRPAASRGGEK